MRRKRTFIAIDLGKDIRNRLIELQRDFARLGGDVNWVEPENLHLTLLFLGEVDNREVLRICRLVGDVAKKIPAFDLQVEGVGCFPNMRRPRVVWAGVGQGKEGVAALHDALEPPLMEAGDYRRENRGFTPHVTLGRIRSESGPTFAEAIVKNEGFSAGETTVREVCVMTSEPSAGGREYTVLSRAKLSRESAK